MIRCGSILYLAILLALPTAACAEEDLFQIGIDALNKGDFRFARACFFDVTREQPKNMEGYNRRGLAYYYLKDYKKAIKDFSEAIRLDPKNADVFNNRGNAQWTK